MLTRALQLGARGILLRNQAFTLQKVRTMNRIFFISPPMRGFAYHDNVLDHYENPRNVGSLDKKDP